ncbi:MAG: ADOP family duplicated permease [Blastocatellia bacterium]
MKFPWFRRQQCEAELDAEIRSHLDEAIRDRIERGESPDQARNNALREFGNVGLVKEVTREMWGWVSLERLGQDLRFGLRMLRKNPGFSLVAILTLALGIGANTAIFSVVNAVLLKALPYADPQRLVVLWTDNPKLQLGFHEVPPANADIPEWRTRTQSFEWLAVFTPNPTDLSSGGEPERVGGVAVSADFFALFGVAPLAGRAFTPAEDQPGSDKVAVISHALWQRRFGGVADIIGKTLTVNAETRMIVGVMPPGFHFPRGPEMPAIFGFAGRNDVWVPLAWDAQRWLDDSRETVVLARLKPGVVLAQAQAELDTIIKQQDQLHTSQAKGWTVEVRPLHTQVVGNTRGLLLILLGAVGVVLLIACVNVANLLLTRATTRSREIAVRSALGASRARVVRQLLTEGVLLSVCGGVAGLLLARWLLPVLIALSPANIPRLDEIRIDWLVLSFTLLVSLCASVLFGLAPALTASRVNLNETLKAAGHRSAGSQNRPWTDSLIIAEVALTFVLLVAAGLCIRSLARLQAVDPGFRASHVTAFDLTLSDKNYPSPPNQIGFFEQLLARLNATPGVEAAAAISVLPFSGLENLAWVTAEGRVSIEREEAPFAEQREITPGYFKVMGVPLLKGRVFTAQDHLSSPLVVVVNETFARQILPGKDPLGSRVRLGRPADENPWRTIVGVVGDVYSSSLTSAPKPQLYLPHAQFNQNVMTVVMKSPLTQAELLAAAKATVKSLDPALPLSKIQTMENVLATATVRPRFGTLLLTLFAGLALLLALIGIYGSVAWTVGQRTPEIGLRMALGATPFDLLRMVIGQGIKPVLIGLALGLAGAFALTRLLSGLLFGVSATDPATFAAITSSLLIVALLACYLPARKATKVDPLVALRHE